MEEDDQTAAELDGTDLGRYITVTTGTGEASGQLWEIRHEADQIDESRLTDREPRLVMGRTTVWLTIGTWVGEVPPDAKVSRRPSSPNALRDLATRATCIECGDAVEKSDAGWAHTTTREDHQPVPFT